MRRHRIVAWSLALAALLSVSVAQSAWAVGPPEMETITFSDSFEDEFLTEECGVEVTISLTGRVKFFTFPDQPIGPQDITSIHVNIVATAGDNQARFNDVGIDLVRVEPDGTAVLMIVGQVPFGFTGVLMIDLETGETILEPQHVVDSSRVCRLLTR
jgi:hypothetical protein